MSKKSDESHKRHCARHLRAIEAHLNELSKANERLRAENDELRGGLTEQQDALIGELGQTAQLLGIDPEGMEWLDILAAIRGLAPRLMPEGMEWPRWDSGEPVFVGERGADGEVTCIKFIGEAGAHVTCCAYGEHGTESTVYGPGERVKRPAPKVLDADGVEIRAGDTLYTRDGTKVMAYAVCAWLPRPLSIKYEDGSTMAVEDPSELTHTPPEEPEFDEGETVYYTVGGKLFRGSYGQKESDAQSIVWHDCRRCLVDTASLSRTPPERPEPVDVGMDADGTCPNGDGTCPNGDSWERLEEAAHVSPHNYCERHGLTLSDGESSERAMAKDLVRRAKALAGADVDRPGEVE